MVLWVGVLHYCQRRNYNGVDGPRWHQGPKPKGVRVSRYNLMIFLDPKSLGFCILPRAHKPVISLQIAAFDQGLRIRRQYVIFAFDIYCSYVILYLLPR